MPLAELVAGEGRVAVTSATMRQFFWLLFVGVTAVLPTAVVQAEAPTQGRLASGVLVYADDDNTRVTKSTTSGSVTHGQNTARATIAFDFITAASVDLVSSASPRGFQEQRTQVDCGGEHNAGDGTRFNGGYNLSHEPDYLTHAMRLGGQHELFERHLVVATSYGVSLSQVGRRNDTAFSRRRYGHDLDLTLTRIINRKLAADLSYILSLVRGFQANAYRYVRLYAPTGGTHLTAVSEHTPSERTRHSLVGRLRWRALPSVFLHSSYRAYADTWGMVAHTLSVRALWNPGGGALALALRGRGHVQGAVSFYQRRYLTFPEVPDLRTGDKELGRMWTALAGAHLEWSPRATWANGLHVGAGADWLLMRYLDFAFLSRRNALLLTLDVTLEL